MKSSLRLIMWNDCHRGCRSCPNKALNDVPVFHGNYRDYSEVILTGGEPLLYPDRLYDTIRDIRTQSAARIYVYTAMSSPVGDVLSTIATADGITLSIYNRHDVISAKRLTDSIPGFLRSPRRSLRLNVFDNLVDPCAIWCAGIWSVVGKEYLNDCPVPSHEDLFRLHP